MIQSKDHPEELKASIENLQRCIRMMGPDARLTGIAVAGWFQVQDALKESPAFPDAANSYSWHRPASELTQLIGVHIRKSADDGRGRAQPVDVLSMVTGEKGRFDPKLRLFSVR